MGKVRVFVEVHVTALLLILGEVVIFPLDADLAEQLRLLALSIMPAVILLFDAVDDT